MKSQAFVERDFYHNPPELSCDATKEECDKAWAAWLLKERKARRNHHKRWMRAQRKYPVSDSMCEGQTLRDCRGVWRQEPGSTNYLHTGI